MKNNLLLIALAGYVGFVLYKKFSKPTPITNAPLPTQPLMPIIPSGVNTRPTNGGGGFVPPGSPGGGRPGIL